ncbi:14523_t:CDS:1, partial [Cetraspora pellucida]
SKTVRSLSGVMCLKDGEVVGVIIGNTFTDSAVDETEKSNSYPIILVIKTASL